MGPQVCGTVCWVYCALLPVRRFILAHWPISTNNTTVLLSTDLTFQPESPLSCAVAASSVIRLSQLQEARAAVAAGNHYLTSSMMKHFVRYIEGVGHIRGKRKTKHYILSMKQSTPNKDFVNLMMKSIFLLTF